MAEPADEWMPVAPEPTAPKDEWVPVQHLEPPAEHDIGGEIGSEVAKGLPRGLIEGTEQGLMMTRPLPNQIVDFARAYFFGREPTPGEKVVASLGIERGQHLSSPAGFAATGAEFVGNPVTWLGPGGPLTKALFAGASAVGSEALGQATEGTPYEGWARTAGALMPMLVPAARVGYARVKYGPTLRPAELTQARDLGVIGPPKPEPTFEDSPAELAERAVPSPGNLSAAVTPEEAKGGGIPGHAPGEYDARGQAWIKKIDAPEDVRDAIENIASENDFFPVARGGEASPAALAAVAEAAGISPGELDAAGFSTRFDSDGKVRAVVQALRQTARDYADASKAARENSTPENLAAATEAEMRHGHVVEYTMGLRAESGRTLAAWKDLLKETEHTKATVEVRKQEETGAAPKGTADVVDAVKEVQDNLKSGNKPGLQKLVDAAKALVENADKPPAPGETKAPTTPEAQSLVDEARKALKALSPTKDAADAAEMDSFRKSLEQLGAGEGKISDTVEAARALLKKNEKPKPAAAGEPKAPSERGRLMGAAKRLVEAAGDEPEKAAKAPVSAEMQGLMETARQAVGRLKNQKLAPELAEFRDALRENDAQRAAEAAKRLVENEKAPAAGEPKPPVEHDQIMAAARRVAKAAEGEAAAREKGQLPPDIQATIDEAKNAVAELRKSDETGLSKLVAQAEKAAADMTKQKAVKDPVEALPPELQALVDKSKRIVDRFGGVQRGEKAALLLARTGRTYAEQEQLARSVSGLTPNQVAKVLNKLRTSPESDKPGWFYWLWQQGLISGLVTHTGYAMVNTGTLLMERVISPTFGAILDRARGQNTSVAGPLYANVAMVRAVPDALSAAAQAFKTGMRVPLESEMRLFARGEESPQTKGATGAYTQTPGPDWGIWNRIFNETQLDTAAKVLGIPGKSANMLHTFYKVLSERASASTKAFQAAHEEGVQGDKFWDRYQHHLDNPTDDALRGAVNDAYTGAFMAALGPKTTEWAHALSHNPFSKWLFPFQHIPWNIQRMSFEYSPFAVLGPEMRSAIMGNKGVPAQNLAIAKMVVGSSVIGFFLHHALSGLATGDYPTDEKERHKWEAMGIRPNSIQIGGNWVSYERLGPIGNIAHMGASLGQIIKNYNGQDDDALTSAIWASSVAAANQVGNEVGFQSLKNVIDALGNEKRADRFVAWQAGSFMPFSSSVSQNASLVDPYQRKATSIIDGLKYRVPLLRETLLPKRDPIFGEPLQNPGYHNVKPSAPVTTDPIKLELERANVFPGPPQDRISGVKLTPQIMDHYEATAGALTHAALDRLVKLPGWYSMPAPVREGALRDAIKGSRAMAEGVIQMQYPQIVRSALQQQKDYYSGASPTVRQKRTPAALEGLQ